MARDKAIRSGTCSFGLYISAQPRTLAPARSSSLKTIFAVLGVNSPEALGPIIEKAYPNSDHYKVGTGEWLVADGGTAMDVSTKLGVTGENSPTTAIVFTTAGYFGRYAAPLWEWIKAKQSANG